MDTDDGVKKARGAIVDALTGRSKDKNWDNPNSLSEITVAHIVVMVHGAEADTGTAEILEVLCEKHCITDPVTMDELGSAIDGVFNFVRGGVES